MPEQHPAFQAAVDVGQELARERREAEKEGKKVVPFGQQRVEPADFRSEQRKGGPEMMKATLKGLEAKMGGRRQALKEYRRMLGGK